MIKKVPLTLIKLRDGRLVPYDKERVSAQVMAAAQAVGNEDPLWPTEVAEAVTLYLRRRATAGVPTEEQLEDAIVKILLRTGHMEMAKAYVLYRSQRRLEQAQVFDFQLTPYQLDLLKTAQESILVRDLSGELFPWSRQSRVSAIAINSGLEPSIAEQLTLEVEQMLRDAGLVPVPLPVILSLHALKFVELGVGPVSDIDPVAVPAQLIWSLLSLGLANDRLPDKAVETSGGFITGQFVLSNIYPKVVRNDHYNGSFQVRSPQLVNRFLSASWRPTAAEGVSADSLTPGGWLELMGLPDRLSPYFARIELPRFDLELARLGTGAGVIDLNVANLLGLRFWPATTERLAIGLGVGMDSDGGADLAPFALSVAKLVGRLKRNVEIVVELGESPDAALVGNLVEASGKTPLRFTNECRVGPTGDEVLGDPVASRIAVNLRRITISGAAKADQLGIEVIRHALEAARVKADFLKSIAKRRSSGVLGGLVADLGYHWVTKAADTVELQFFGLDSAVFELTGNWPSENGESAKYLQTLAMRLAQTSRDLAEEKGLCLTIRAGMEPALEEFFGMLDRAVLGLPAPPPPPAFQLTGDPGHLFHGPYPSAWPKGVAVELRAASEPGSALTCVQTALGAGASAVLIEKDARCSC